MITKKILNWVDKKDEALNKKVEEADELTFSDGAKAFGLGAIEGFIDWAVVTGAVVFVNMVRILVTKPKK